MLTLRLLGNRSKSGHHKNPQKSPYYFYAPFEKKTVYKAQNVCGVAPYSPINFSIYAAYYLYSSLM